jgi:lysozyme
MMNVSPAGRAFIERNEGLDLEAYWDKNGYAVGYGHHGPNVTASTVVTRDQADSLLAADLVWVEKAIANAIFIELGQNQFDALADFVYNDGAGALKTSTLARLLNSGVVDPARITMAFCMWDKDRDDRTGALVDDPKLLARRRAEAAMFLSTS